MKKFDAIVDLQFGSTGKGAIAGYLANNREYAYDMAISANMPNAGHTFIDHLGQKMVHKVLPSALASGTKIAMLAPSAVFNMEQLIKELRALDGFGYRDREVYIHEHAVLLTDDHKREELGEERPGSTDTNSYKRIGSTQQGSAVALMDKIRRDIYKNPTVGATYGLGRTGIDNIHVVSHNDYINMLYNAHDALVEGSQGYSLGLNAGFYPYCTSRDCTLSRLLADCLVPPHEVAKVIGVARTYPIRVGGTSGPGYPDQEELTWERIGQPEERTTVTNRVRRVFTFSQMQIEEAIHQNGPDEIFLNFCNYQTEQENNMLIHIIDDACERLNKFGRVAYTGHGPAIADIRDRARNHSPV